MVCFDGSMAAFFYIGLKNMLILLFEA